MATIATGSAGSLVDPNGPTAGQKQRKKGKFRLKERSSSSVREKFINDPAYTEDVRHLALPMRRNSGPEHDPGRKFYMIPKKKSNSVGKDYSQGSGSLRIGGSGTGGGGAGTGTSDFYTLDVEAIRRAGLNVPEVKPRRKKYNHHSSAELLNRLLNTDESSSSDGVPRPKGQNALTLDRSRGRSLDRRSYTATAVHKEAEFGRGDAIQRQEHGRSSRNLSRRHPTDQEEGMPAGSSGDPFPDSAGKPLGDRETGSVKGGRFQIGKRFLKGEIGIKSFNYYLLKEGLKSSKKNLLKQRSAPVAVGDTVETPISTLPEPLPPQIPMEPDSPELEVKPSGKVGLEHGEENIYEEIYFENHPKRPTMVAREGNDEKIQFIDCELCVQQCGNANCDVCHGHGAEHTAQQHEHHHHQLQQQRQAEQKQQNIYEQLKQHGSGGSSGGSGHSANNLPSVKASSKSLDVEDQLYQRKTSQQHQHKQLPQPPPAGQERAGSVGNLVGDEGALYGAGNVLQYQSYNPNNPNVYKLETTPVAFSSDYSPLQQIYYKPQSQQSQQETGVVDPAMASSRQHIYQRPHHPGTMSSGSDYYQELSHKKSSSSSDSLQQQRRMQANSGIYYQKAPGATVGDEKSSGRSPAGGSNVGANIYKVGSNASILSETSGRSEGSYRQLQHVQTHMQQHQQQPAMVSSSPAIALASGQQRELPTQAHGQQHHQQQQQQQQTKQQPYGRTGGNMSDSSLGDSLFSYSANRRYFGSSESCRFASETCRRCSVEVDKCSFSDTCRYSDCRNCDCSSSYFSSDFDDTGHGGTRGSKGRVNPHGQEAPGYYQTPPYAEDFMKHVNAVKRGNHQQHQQQQQQQVAATTHLMAGGKIYETPPTYVGMMPVTVGASGLQRAREPTYETLRNPPYSMPMVGSTYETTASSGSLAGSGRLAISQSHEALLSPTRRSRSSRSTDTDGQYPVQDRRSPVSHYSRIRRPHQSNTLPASMRSGRRNQQQGEYDPAGYSVIRESPASGRATTSGGSTLPKSFSLQQQHSRNTPIISGRSASLLAVGHEYAEISKPSGRKPIPPPISTIPSTREARARSKAQAAASERAPSPAQYARTGQSGIAGSTSTSVERKSRERTPKTGAKSPTKDKAPPPSAADKTSGRESSANATGGGSSTGAKSGKPKTGSTRRREFVSSQQQQQRAKRRMDVNITDDEDDDDEVFLSDKVYERPSFNNRARPAAFSFTST
ncbi:AGAP006378-PA-like protein [Anopheles sinensis]|uniref:AGAP006378-PA-like protein n=1 Tax=Anopheles sinensis TaxID=74873 RepID=A0A084WEH2_ANOSI|nr:AGAP006378-PA-like protein [Anopheles sinensis]